MHASQPHAGLITLAVFARAHAVWMLLATGAALAGGTVFAAVAGALSLATCAGLQRGRWTPSGRFGIANGLTALRLAMTVALGALCISPPGPAAAALALAIFAIDGLDGRVARLRGEVSTFGAYFDMECDALLVLVCALALHQHDRLSAFILVPGLLRYGYLLLLVVLPVPGGETPHTRVERYAFFVLMVSLIASLWPLPLHRPLAMLATSLIAYSFARSIHALFRRT